MDFIGGALPNVMFVVGMIAIGIGLGVELKIIEIKAELSKNGRIGAFAVGAALIGTSIFLYNRPPQTGSAPAQPVAQANVAAVLAGQQATIVPPAALSPTVASAQPAAAPTSIPVAPTAPAPTSVPAAAPQSFQEAVTLFDTAVDQAAADGDLDSGIAKKLHELTSKIDEQAAEGKSKEIRKTIDELIYTIGDAQEDGKLSSTAAAQLQVLATPLRLAQP